MTEIPTWCQFCKHTANNGRTCRAYPQGTPARFGVHGDSHSSKQLGDRGILFELDETKRAEFEETLPYLHPEGV